jgi:CNT family concentrative nucleoside transporter
MERLQPLIGIVLILALAFAFSADRRVIDKRTVLWGLLLQFVFAYVVLDGSTIAAQVHRFIPIHSWALGLVAIVLFGIMLVAAKSLPHEIAQPLKLFTWLVAIVTTLRMNLLERFFDGSRVVVAKIIQFANAGASFVFGSLASDNKPVGFVFAFGVLPTIIFVASIFAILYYFGVMQKIVAVLARFMSRFMGASGAESTSVAASIFMGQTEAPLTIRPYLPDLTVSEFFTVMVSGMCHISAGIMPAYVLVGGVDIKHLLVSVILTAPGAILLAKMLIPETEEPKTGAEVKVDVPITDVNVVDAAARGASEGGVLALNVAAMLIAFIAIIALINGGIGLLHDSFAAYATSKQDPTLLAILPHVPAQLEDILGAIFSVVAWCIGVTWHDATSVGKLMGIRFVLNEFVAYIDLKPMAATLDPRSFIIATYALCGFANISSIAIQIGGIGALAPNRRHDLARLGVRALLAGTLANWLAAAIAAILI